MKDSPVKIVHAGPRPWGDVITTPYHLRSEEYLRESRWLEANTGWGSYRATQAGFQTANLRIWSVRMPGGQRSPWHGSGASTWPELGKPFPPLGRGGVFLVVQGEMDFHAAGQVFRMKPLDMLPINAVVYSYANPGLTDLLFFCLGGESTGKGPGGAAPSGPAWQGDPNADEMRGSHPYYKSKPAHSPSPDEAKRISLVPWEEYRHRDIEWTGSWGSHWGAYPFVETGHRLRMIRLPAGQVSERRTLNHEAIYIGIDEHDTEFEIGSSVFGLRRLDAVGVPPNTPFRFLNSGMQEVMFFELWPNL